MDNRLVVSTECPTCGAPLDFTEGSNAVRCLYCRSHLLVTGRKQVLSYMVTPTLDAQRALALVRRAWQDRGALPRLMSPQVYFIPYYRLTGQDLRWETNPQKSSLQLDHLLDQPRMIDELARVTRRGDTQDGMEFRDRWLEKNFVACPLQGVGLYSLGVRPTVVRLELFHKQVVESFGKSVAVNLSPAEALSRGLKTDDSQIVYRVVVGHVLSLIYFPFWVVEEEQQGETLFAIVDAVSHSVVTLDAPSSLYTTLERQQQENLQTIGFRPFVCPNCGWELPLRPDDIVFFCSSCQKAWQIQGDKLADIPYQILATPSGCTPASLTFLPFWIGKSARGHMSVEPFFLPAFRYRRAKTLVDLAQRLSLRQPVPELRQEKFADFQGCSYDQDDAFAILQLLAIEEAAKRREHVNARQEQALSLQEATLTWVPFKRQGNFLVDPFTGMHLSSNLLI